MKHSKAIIAIWVVIFILCVPFMLRADSVLEYELTKMTGSDSESAQGNAYMDQYFTNKVDMDEVLVVKYDTAVPEQATAVNTLATSIGNLLKTRYGTNADSSAKVTLTNVGSYTNTGEGADTIGVMIFSIKTTDDGIKFADETGHVRDTVAQAKSETGVNLTTYVSGNAALTYDTMTAANNDVNLIHILSIVLIFTLLALFFGAIVTAIVPPLGFGAAYAVAMVVLFHFAYTTSVFYLTSTLMVVTMLGAGCDYGLFIITRYREELKKGAQHHEALLTSVEWAGESVFTSGMSVIIGFACLTICDFSMVRNMGLMLAVGIVFALIAALTFVPALVNLLGEKTFWPHTIAKYKTAEEGSHPTAYGKVSHVFHRYFQWVARVTRKHALPIVVVAVVISVPSLYAYATFNSSYDMISVEPNGEAKDGLYAIMDETYGGTLMPTYVVVEFPGTATTATGTADLGVGKPVPYVVWNENALNTTTYTGYIPTLMLISEDLKSNDLVATASGLNSWQTLFFKAVYTQVKTLHPEWDDTTVATATATQIATWAADPTGNAAQIAAVNTALVTLMPSAVHDYVQTLVGAATAMGKSMPMSELDPVNHLTLSNFVDGILNVGTGLLSDDGKAASIMIVTKEKPMSDNTMSFQGWVKDKFHGKDGYDTVYSAAISESKVCGTNAAMYDISKTVTSQFDYIKVIVVVLLLILLFLILGSYVTPVRAILCILMSVVWTLALTFVVFQEILSLPVVWILPIVLFVVLLGLGLDYEIFITTRVRENRVRGMSNDDAIDAAITSASGTISLCALIMGGTFCTLLVGSSSMIQEFGFALGIGIFIDGLFMVTYVGPALMHLLGEWSWKGPAFLQKKQRNQ
ncbi:MAG: MMPL family transporter [Candidatus Methanomethylophilus sp.]|nr:MMPL family transporter [Methanomethylophilus sp.]